ncbi:MAG: hypothetical protein C0P74_001080 [Gammaproteobacteria bacterium]|nr:hypothetical protein [Gammaproteobacteria bacterium]
MCKSARITAEADDARRFLPTTLFICAGLLFWAADFLATYVIAALACARGFALSSVVNIPFVAFVGSVLTVVAGSGTLVIVLISARRLQGTELDTSARFIYFLASTMGVIGLVAIAFNALPAWLLANECASAG